MQMIKAVWGYRGFIEGMVKREFQSRYTRSVLGPLWAVIDPLSMIVIYSLIFSQFMGARLAGSGEPWAYTIHICAGIVAWEYFAEVITRSQNMFLDNANLLKKTHFPRATLPTIVLTTASINFAIIFALFLVFLLLIGKVPGPSVLCWIPLLAIQQGIAVGLGLILGTLNVFFRDVGQGMQVILRFWFWLTPIVYPATVLPDWVRELLLTWNPMAALVGAYQAIMLGQAVPPWQTFIPQFVLMVLLLAVGFFAFMRLSGEIVDEL